MLKGKEVQETNTHTHTQNKKTNDKELFFFLI